jgi:hypothetical protein
VQYKSKEAAVVTSQSAITHMQDTFGAEQISPKKGKVGIPKLKLNK